MRTVKEKSKISEDIPFQHVKKVRRSRIFYFHVRMLHLLFDIYFVNLYIYVIFIIGLLILILI